MSHKVQFGKKLKPRAFPTYCFLTTIQNTCWAEIKQVSLLIPEHRLIHVQLLINEGLYNAFQCLHQWEVYMTYCEVLLDGPYWQWSTDVFSATVITESEGLGTNTQLISVKGMLNYSVAIPDKCIFLKTSSDSYSVLLLPIHTRNSLFIILFFAAIQVFYFLS